MRRQYLIYSLFVIGVCCLVSGLYLHFSNSLKPLSVISPILPTKTAAKRLVSSAITPQTKTASFSGQTVAMITQVLDGDTVITQTGQTIRYLGINAPEKDQPYGSSATELNKSLVLGKEVRLEYDKQTTDRYGRTLAYVYIGDLMVNNEMVADGLAVTESIQPNVLHDQELSQADQAAKKNCLGLWQGLCSQVASGSKCISINQINANPLGDDTLNKNGEWIDFQNSCSNSIDMSGWLLKDNSTTNSYMFKSYSLPANSDVKLHSGCGADTSTDLYWKCPEQKYAVWNNDTDHAFLYNNDGQLVADYQY